MKRRKVGRPKRSKIFETNMSVVYVKCNGACGKVRAINTTSPEIYTEELREQFVCLFCK